MICEIDIKEASYNQLRVLKDIHFDMKEGDILAIVGESGAGKTSLVRIISGLEKFYSLEYDGYVRLNSDLDMIPQNLTDSLDPLFKIRDQMEEITSDRDKIKRTLEKVGFSNVEDVLNSYPHNLSGGMKQRVLIAMALIRSKFILADEFTSALDSITKIKVVGLLKELNKKDKITLIFVTHDMGLLDFYGRVMVLFDGMIVEMGDINEVRANPFHPYTMFLLYSSIKKGMHYRKSRFSELVVNREMACPFAQSCDRAKEICKNSLPPLRSKSGRLVRCHF